MYSVKLIPYELIFKTPAATSRGVMHTRKIWYVTATGTDKTATGEVSFLPGLSIDDRPDFERHLYEMIPAFTDLLNKGQLNTQNLADLLPLQNFPSIRFAFETLLHEAANKISKCIFPSPFFNNAHPVSINGLVWMDTASSMLKQVEEKIQAGFTCIKLKIGALDFDAECRLLETVRKKYNAFKIEIRVDANGAFSADTALEQLQELNRFSLHSIEQPIKAGNPEMMQELCAKSKLPIALDEELIGEYNRSQLLQLIKPAYIIIKPSLLGGFDACNRWITEAQKKEIGYWITSALESNIGLNAVAQYAATLPINIPQGLGTGQLYTNNPDSPLTIKNGQLFYDPSKAWAALPLLQGSDSVD